MEVEENVPVVKEAETVSEQATSMEQRTEDLTQLKKNAKSVGKTQTQTQKKSKGNQSNQNVKGNQTKPVNKQNKNSLVNATKGGGDSATKRMPNVMVKGNQVIVYFPPNE